MKNWISLLLTILISINGLVSQEFILAECCGEDDPSESCLFYSYNQNNEIVGITEKAFGENVRQTLNSFDASGRLAATTNSEWDGTAWSNLDQVLYSYNINGDTTAITIKTSDGMGGLVNVSRTLNSYDANGRLAAITNSEWSGTAWVNLDQVLFSYNVNGDLTATTVKTSDGMGGLVNVSQTLNSYDANGRLSATTDSTWNGTAWVQQDQVLSSYNANGDLTATTIKTSDGMGGLVNENQTLNSYDANGRLSASTISEWNGTAWVPLDQVLTSYNANGDTTAITIKTGDGMGGLVNVSQELNSYDANGRLAATTNSEWNGSAWIPLDQVFTSYNANGDLTAITVKTSDGMGGLVNVSQTLNSYDGNGRLSATTNSEWNGTAFIPLDQVLTSYNANGDLTATTIKVGDGMGGLINVSQVLNSYDANGRLAATTNNEWNGTAWVPMDQQLFSYNATGFATAITNKVSDGMGGLVNLSQSLNSYDVNGNLVAGSVSEWDGTQWVISTVCQYSWTVSMMIDADGDGFFNDEDCDDNNADVNPDADEIPYNGLDDDCDPATLDDDLDEDGFLFADDCDDTDAGINPDAVDIPDNDIDEDCDGEDATSVGVNDFDLGAINYYPNPTVDILNIENNTSETLQVNIFNQLGQRVFTKSNLNSLNAINLSDLVTGQYVIKICNTNCEKVMINKLQVIK